MRYLLTSIILFCCLYAQAQLVPLQTNVDVGQVQTEIHEMYIPFVFTNQGNRKEYVLKVEPGSMLIRYLKPRTAIMPGASDTLRIYFDPEHKGNFSENIIVYVSSSTLPLQLNISGNIARVSTDPTLQCYDFKHTTSTKHALDKTILAIVRDSITHIPIGKAQVYITSLQGLSGTGTTDKAGSIALKVSPDQYTFMTSAVGYKRHQTVIYLNHSSADFYIDLASEKLLATPMPTESFANTPSGTVPTTMPADIKEVPVPNITLTNSNHVDDTVHRPIYTGELDPELYKANNIVFVIDISGSMGLSHKMDYLKKAMKVLTQQLRPFDKITLVYFSSDARIVMPTTYATDTARIDSIINRITTGGTTSANKALLKAHEVVTQAYVQNANNQVILATDGIFSVDDKIVNMYKNDTVPVQFTIVGLAVDKESDKNLEHLTQHLHGDYVNVFKQTDIHRVLLDEIKRRSAL